MKRSWFVATLAGMGLLALAPMSQATVILFNVTLSGSAESPPNASPATGSALLQFDTLAHTLDFHVEFSDLITPTTAAHLHCCVGPPGVASVVVSLLAGFPIGATSGIYDGVFDLTSTGSFSSSFVAANGGTAAGAEAALLAGMLAGESYLNIHTTAFPGGEIRGFAAVTSVAEPATLALLAFGLVLIGAARRR